MAQVSWTPCICAAGPGSGRARPRHGTRPGHLQPLPRPAPADGVLRAAARPRAPAAHRLGDRTGSPALSASATTARATATADGPVWRGHADHADDLLGRVRADDAGVPARCCLAGGGRERCRVGRMAVILGDPDGDVIPAGRFVHARHRKRDMRHFGADLAGSLVLLAATERGARCARRRPLSGGILRLRTTVSPLRWSSGAARAHAVVVSVLTPAEILIAARRLAGARPHLAGRGWDRASRGPVAAVPR